MKTPTSRTSDNAAPRREAGVTLIEMIVALGIVAMIIMLAMPRFQDATPRLELRTAAEALRADLHTARNAALGLNRETTLSIDLEAAAWWGDPPVRGAEGAAPDGAAMAMEIALQERVSDAIGRIRFFPEGGATGGVVTLEGAGTAFEVRVDWFDGRVTIAELEPE